MQAHAAERNEFAPPPQPGLWRAFALALAAHLLLVLALTFGLQWKRDSENLAAEAELWSSTPQQAAPREALAPPPPPAPVVKEQPRPQPPAPTQADIALEREKQKQAEAQRKLEEEKREKEKRARLEAQRKADEQRKQEQTRLATENRKKEEDARKKRQEEDAKKFAQLREENLKRMQGLAGASGSETARGNALQSSGPSTSWAGRIRGRVKPNIVFSDDVPGNPEAVVEVRLAPDGTIVGTPRLVRSSGVRSWDDAVVKALIKTEVLPRDVDGRVHTPVELHFRPRD